MVIMNASSLRAACATRAPKFTSRASWRLKVVVASQSSSGPVSTAVVPQYAKNYPPEWQAAATPGSSYRRKIRAMFNMLDVDKNGTVEYDDVRKIADNWIKYAGIKPDSAYATDIHKTFADVFALQWSATKDLSGRSSFEDLVRNTIDAVQPGGAWDSRENLLKRSPVAIDFKLIDLDGDGTISPQEYEAFWNAHGLDPRDARKIFDEIDGNGDGYITFEEFSDAFWNWFSTPHGDPATHGLTMGIFGPIPDTE